MLKHYTIQIPKAVGYITICKNFKFDVYKKPNIIRRFFMNFLLGFEYTDL